ncbi:MAG: hypothetical protein AB1486_13735 [Planctomycetota bacterium]
MELTDVAVGSLVLQMEYAGRPLTPEHVTLAPGSVATVEIEIE